MIPSLLLSAALSTHPAAASVRGMVAYQQPDNVLRETIHVMTSERARVSIHVWPTLAGAAAGWDTEFTSTAATDAMVPLWGLTPSTRYDYRVTVRPASGRPYSVGGRIGFTTRALPTNLPRVSASRYVGTPDVQWMVFDAGYTDGSGSAVMMADANGQVVWYQAPPAGSGDVLDAWYDDSSASVYAIIEGGRVMRWALDGTVEMDWNQASPLDAVPHHELQVLDGVLYTLTARATEVDGFTFVEDGIEGYDADGNLLYEWWAYEDGGLDLVSDAPVSWEPAGMGYWKDVFPAAVDWLHANSLQVREEADGLKAYVSLRLVDQIAKVDLATGEVEWLLGDNGSPASDGAGDFILDGDGLSSRWFALQHHARMEDDGLLYLFDNGDGSSASRALALSLDEETGVASVVRSVDFSDFIGRRGFDGVCASRGSAFRTETDHLLMSCATEGFVADYDASDTLLWSMSVAGDRGVYRFTPMSPPGR